MEQVTSVIKVKGYYETFTRYLYVLQQEGLFCDVKLETAEGHISAHKIVLLANRSPFLQRQIQGVLPNDRNVLHRQEHTRHIDKNITQVKPKFQNYMQDQSFSFQHCESNIQSEDHLSYQRMYNNTLCESQLQSDILGPIPDLISTGVNSHSHAMLPYQQINSENNSSILSDYSRYSENSLIVISDFRNERFTLIQNVLCSLYTGEVSLSSDNVQSIRKVYQVLELEDFVAVCDEFISHISPESVSEHSYSKNTTDVGIETSDYETSDDQISKTDVSFKMSVPELEKEGPNISSSSRSRKTLPGKGVSVVGTYSSVRSVDKRKDISHNYPTEDEAEVTDGNFDKKDSTTDVDPATSAYMDSYINSVERNSEHEEKSANAKIEKCAKEKLCNGKISQSKQKSVVAKSKTKSCKRVKKMKMQKVCAHCDKQDDQCVCKVDSKGFKKKCPGCNLRFLDRSKWYAHMKSHHATWCKLCDFHNLMESNVAQHMYVRHKVFLDEVKYPLLKCQEKNCTFTCIKELLMQRHIEEKHREPKFTCTVCGKQFSTGVRFRMHIKSHNPEENKYVCDICGKKFHQKGLLNYHINKIHKNLLLCHICTWTGKHAKQVAAHLYSKHGVPLPEDVKVYKCDQCDYIAFYPKKLANHKLSHSGVKAFQCQECGKMFTTLDTLRSHSRVHQEKSIACKYPGCEYRSKTNNLMKVHINSSHTNVKPFLCHLCQYSCKLRGNLDKHLRGTHKLSITTTKDLWQKMTEEGKGYEDVLERRRKMQNREAIPLPVPCSIEQNTMKDIDSDNLFDNRNFSSCYSDKFVPFSAQMPYISLPTGIESGVPLSSTGVEPTVSLLSSGVRSGVHIPSTVEEANVSLLSTGIEHNVQLTSVSEHNLTTYTEFPSSENPSHVMSSWS